MSNLNKLREQLAALPREELALLRKDFEGSLSSPEQTFDWSRDPFTIAQELCGALLTVQTAGESLELRIANTQGWREMGAKRAADSAIAARDPGTIHIFPTKRFKQRAEAASKAEPYNILAIVASTSQYLTGLVTINGLYRGRDHIPSSAVFAPLAVEEVDCSTTIFFASGLRTFQATEERIRALVTPYEIKGMDPSRVQGYKISKRAL